MNCCARSAWSDCWSVTIGYFVSCSDDPGMATEVTWSPAATASVVYTIPASASPSVTLASTDLTSTSWLTGLAVMWFWSSSSWPIFPQGAVGTQTTYLTDGLSRSAKDWMSAGLDFGVASTMTFVANTVGVEAWAD